MHKTKVYGLIALLLAVRFVMTGQTLQFASETGVEGGGSGGSGDSPSESENEAQSEDTAQESASEDESQSGESGGDPGDEDDQQLPESLSTDGSIAVDDNEAASLHASGD